VTTILGRFKEPEGLMYWAHKLGTQGIDFRERQRREAAAGTITHDWSEDFIHGREIVTPTPRELDVTEDEHERIIGMATRGFDAFRRWFDRTKIRIRATEVPLVHDTHLFGGCIDAIGESEDGAEILDWKTSGRVYLDHVLQIGAYRELSENGRCQWKRRPRIIGEEIRGGHLVRFGKHRADFHHLYLPRDVLDDAFEMFMHLRRAYEVRERIQMVIH
jgi:hypothetical protein